MHFTCKKPKTESQAEFLFSDLKFKSELSFEEWFEIVKKFHQMCAQVHCPPASSEVKTQTQPNLRTQFIPRKIHGTINFRRIPSQLSHMYSILQLLYSEQRSVITEFSIGQIGIRYKRQ